MVTRSHRTVPGLAAPERAHHHPADPAPLGTAAAHTVVTPASDNTHLTVGAVEGQASTRQVSFGHLAGDGERFAILQAHSALAGSSVIRSAVGYYVHARWSHARPLDAFDEAEQPHWKLAP